MEEEKPATGEPNPLKQIRTYEGDVASAIKNQNESIVSIQRAEEVRRGGPANPEEGGGQKALIMAILTLVLVSLGGAGAYYAYKTYAEKTAPPVLETPENQFVSAASVSEINASTLSRQSLIGSVWVERGKTRESSEITQIELRRGTLSTDELLSSQDFLTRLNAHAPEPLVRALNPLFMLGALGADPPHVFLIMKLDSFVSAFPGMLEWEPRIAEDILPLFVTEDVLLTVPTGTKWSDITLQNRDARILKNTSGDTVLIYAFYDNSWLLIADKEATLETLFTRLDSQKLSR